MSQTEDALWHAKLVEAFEGAAESLRAREESRRAALLESFAVRRKFLKELHVLLLSLDWTYDLRWDSYQKPEDPHWHTIDEAFAELNKE